MDTQTEAFAKELAASCRDIIQENNEELLDAIRGRLDELNAGLEELQESAIEVATALDDVLNVIGDLLVDGDLGLYDAKVGRAKLLSLHERYARSADLNDFIKHCLQQKERKNQ